MKTVHYTYSLNLPDDMVDVFVDADCIVSALQGVDSAQLLATSSLIRACTTGLQASLAKQMQTPLIGGPRHEDVTLVLQHLTLLGLVVAGMPNGCGISINVTGSLPPSHELAKMLAEAVAVIANVDGGEIETRQSPEWVESANRLLDSCNRMLAAALEAKP